jgi:hypothetical protein
MCKNFDLYSTLNEKNINSRKQFNFPSNFGYLLHKNYTMTRQTVTSWQSHNPYTFKTILYCLFYIWIYNSFDFQNNNHWSTPMPII